MGKNLYAVSVISSKNYEINADSRTELSIPTSPRTKEKKANRRYIGIIFTLLSSITFSVGTLIAKILTSEGYHPFNIGVWRFFGIFIMYTPIISYYGCQKKAESSVFTGVFRSDPKSTLGLGKTWILLCSRWLTGCSAIILQYMSLQYLTLADSLVITFSTPVFVTLASPIILRERCSFVAVGLAVFTLLGVGVMMRPPLLTGAEAFDSNTLMGFAFAFSAMVVTGLSFILIQRLRQIHYSIMLTFFGLWGTVECILLSFIYLGKLDYPLGVGDWLRAVVLAILSVTSQTCLTFALKFEKAGPVSLIRTCDVLFGLVLQYFILGNELDLISLGGQSIVMSGVIATIAREWINKLDDNHPVKNKWACFLK